MGDRVVRGAFASMLAGLFITATTQFFFYIHFAKARWVDYMASLILGHKAQGAGDLAMGFFIEFIFYGGLGALYAIWVVPRPEAGSYILRAIGYGLGVWFITLSIGTMFKIPLLYKVAWQTAVTNVIAVTGWGILLGWIMQRWDEAALVRR